MVSVPAVPVLPAVRLVSSFVSLYSYTTVVDSSSETSRMLSWRICASVVGSKQLFGVVVTSALSVVSSSVNSSSLSRCRRYASISAPSHLTWTNAKAFVV